MDEYEFSFSIKEWDLLCSCITDARNYLQEHQSNLDDSEYLAKDAKLESLYIKLLSLLTENHLV